MLGSFFSSVVLAEDTKWQGYILAYPGPYLLVETDYVYGTYTSALDAACSDAGGTRSSNQCVIGVFPEELSYVVDAQSAYCATNTVQPDGSCDENICENETGTFVYLVPSDLELSDFYKDANDCQMSRTAGTEVVCDDDGYNCYITVTGTGQEYTEGDSYTGVDGGEQNNFHDDNTTTQSTSTTTNNGDGSTTTTNTDTTSTNNGGTTTFNFDGDTVTTINNNGTTTNTTIITTNTTYTDGSSTKTEITGTSTTTPTVTTSTTPISSGTTSNSSTGGSVVGGGSSTTTTNVDTEGNVTDSSTVSDPNYENPNPEDCGYSNFPDCLISFNEEGTPDGTGQDPLTDGASGQGLSDADGILSGITNPLNMNPITFNNPLPAYTTCLTIDLNIMGSSFIFPSATQCQKLESAKTMIGWLIYMYTIYALFGMAVTAGTRV